jgi:hypothetical protein
VIRKAIAMEIGNWRSLFLWVRRRVAGQGPGVQTFSYGKQITPLLWAFVFVSAIELPVVHLLIPWDTVRLVVLVLSVWGLLFMIGMAASMKVFPHLLDAGGIRVRYGATTDIHLPWHEVEAVRARRGTDEAAHNVAVMNQTRIAVSLRRPRAFEGEEVGEVRLYVDDPRGFVTAANALLEDQRAE